MRKWLQIGILVVLTICVIGVVVSKLSFSKNEDTSLSLKENEKNLPVLVDLGATTCIPCKKMVPVLEETKKLYAGRVSVRFIDVYKSPREEVDKYGINVIPTQVFYDKYGKEVFRHEGFFSKEEIVNVLDKMGVK